MAKLLIHETTGIREFELMDEEVRIGREFDNNLRIADPSVSRYHAVVRKEGDGYVIVDLDSVNGITVMGRKVAMAALFDGVQFCLGQVKVTLQDGETASAHSSEPTPEKGVHLERVHYKRHPGKEPHTIAFHGDPREGLLDASRTVFRPGSDAASAWIISWFLLGAGHAIINGQQRKWAFNLLTLFLASIASCILAHIVPLTAFGTSKAGFYAVVLIWVFPMVFIHALYTIDAFKTAKRLREGRTIMEDEYSLLLLFGIVRFFDKLATRNRA